MLDKMLAAIGLDRRSEDPATAAYITNVLPWRPVDNRDPSTDEAQMLWAFLERHIELAEPEIIVALGKSPAAALTRTTINMTPPNTMALISTPISISKMVKPPCLPPNLLLCLINMRRTPLWKRWHCWDCRCECGRLC